MLNATELYLLNSCPPCWLAGDNPYNYGRLSAINFATSLTISPSEVSMKSFFLFGLQGFTIWTHVYDIFLLAALCAVYGAFCHKVYFILYLTPWAGTTYSLVIWYRRLLFLTFIIAFLNFAFLYSGHLPLENLT